MTDGTNDRVLILQEVRTEASGSLVVYTRVFNSGRKKKSEPTDKTDISGISGFFIFIFIFFIFFYFLIYFLV